MNSQNEPRNLSPQQMFQRMARDHAPACAFAGDNRADVEVWKRDTLPKVLATLGDAPPAVPANAEQVGVWEHDGLVKERWLIDVGPHIAAAFQINRPADMPSGEKRPAILCWHGHSPHGKEPVMGNDSSAPLRAAIENFHYNYGHLMAKAGFVTFAIDWIGCGERNDAGKRHYLSVNRDRDWCNLYYLHATMLGMTSLSINLAHGRAATDFACSLPYIDPDRLGVMGLSGGGTMTLWTALTDARFKAAEIICYSDLWAAFGFRDINYCGMQVAPGLFKLVDLPDLQGLLCPKPLLIDIGIHDTCFLLDSANACFGRLQRIYTAHGSADQLWLDRFPGEHAWGGNRSRAFFSRYL